MQQMAALLAFFFVLFCFFTVGMNQSCNMCLNLDCLIVALCFKSRTPVALPRSKTVQDKIFTPKFTAFQKEGKKLSLSILLGWTFPHVGKLVNETWCQQVDFQNCE